uniref:Uncharacterized protein n=1 Tax=Amphimedon queenslandica TaxID=400682 RepID=A0A1X7T968_AMPQE
MIPRAPQDLVRYRPRELYESRTATLLRKFFTILNCIDKYIPAMSSPNLSGCIDCLSACNFASIESFSDEKSSSS